MSQEPDNICRYLVGWSGDYGHAVTRMTQMLAVEAQIARKHRDPSRFVQLRHDLFILHSLAAPIEGDLPDRQTPCFEKLPLAARRVLVEQDQLALRRLAGRESSSA